MKNKISLFLVYSILQIMFGINRLRHHLFGYSTIKKLNQNNGYFEETYEVLPNIHVNLEFKTIRKGYNIHTNVIHIKTN